MMKDDDLIKKPVDFIKHAPYHFALEVSND